MAASFVASFLTFILLGIYSLYNGLGFTDNGIIKVSVFLALLFNATFYHYVAGYTEMDHEMREKLKQTSTLEWWIRVLNQCVLLSLWFWLDHAWEAFGIALIVLYTSYFLWDIVTWRALSDSSKSFLQNLWGRKLFWIDIAGLVLSGAYIKVGNVVLGKPAVDDKDTVFIFALLSAAYLLLPFVGMRWTKFNPLEAKYRNRPGLH